MDQKKLIIALLAATLIGILLYSTLIPIIWSANDHDKKVGPKDIDSNVIDIVKHDATKISTMFTTLNGELVDMGNYSSVVVFFVWGENPGEYTKETPKQTMTSPGTFSTEISDLFEPDNTYYFQARADPEGMGEEVSFYVY